jgi:CAAX prenyl protease-like protein
MPDNPNPNANTPSSGPSDNAQRSDKQRALLAFALPLVVYMLVGSFEPEPLRGPAATPPAGIAQPEETPDGGLVVDDILPDAGAEDLTMTTKRMGIEIPRRLYPTIYTVKIVATLAVLAWAFPVYLQWPLRVSPLAIGVGVVGVVLWILCAKIDPTSAWLQSLGPDHWLTGVLGSGERPSYDPLSVLGPTAAGYGFLAIRFFGLALLVPVIEEAFLRAFLMRFVMHDNWTEIPFGVVNRTAVAVGILVPVVYHPEHLAALVWFSLVTWLMVRTKNFWDCVAAHAVTNLLLGIYVVTQGQWWLW